MKIHTELVHNGAILTLQGKILVGEGDDALRECVMNLLKLEAVRTLVLDLAEVPYVDAAGLGEIVRSHTAASKQGVRLVLCRPSRKIRDLLTITKLLTVLEVYDSREGALASFQ